MRVRTVRSVALSALLVGAAPAMALDVSGRIGLGYSRFEFTPPDGPSVTEPHLDIDLGLDARGVVVRRDVVDWRLGVAYRRISDERSGVQSRLQTRLLYSGQATVLGSGRSPLTLTLGASRSQTDFSLDPALDTFGQSVVDQATTSLTVRPGNLPPLGGSYTYRKLQEDVPGLPIHERETHQLQGFASSGSASHRFSATYAGEMNDGTYESDQYDQHAVSVVAGAPLPGKAELSLDDRYLRVQPKTSGPNALLQDNNAFRLYARDRGTYGDRHTLQYLYTHLLTETPASGPSEATRNSVRYEGDHLLTSPTLFTRWTVDASLNQSRLGAGEVATSGETLAATLWWRRPATDGTYYEIFGGPLVGFLQSDAGNDVGHGLSATARLTQPWLGQTAYVSYEGAYSRDLFAVTGWLLRQSLTGELTGQLGLARYTATLRGSSVRSRSPLFGEGATRLVELYSTVNWSRFELEVRGLLEDGITGATTGDFVSDGLFIPAPFDTSNRQVMLRGIASLFPGLRARAHFRLGSSSRPGEPRLDQTEVIGALDYQYAAFAVSVEDRVDWYDQPNGRLTTNTFFVRFYRRLDWRF